MFERLCGPPSRRAICQDGDSLTDAQDADRCERDKAKKGTKHNEKCRIRVETEMRREPDPRIKAAVDKHTEFEAEKMRTQEAIDARRATEAARRGCSERLAKMSSFKSVKKCTTV